MALSPAVLLADSAMYPDTTTPAEIPAPNDSGVPASKTKQAPQQRKQNYAAPEQFEQIQDIPDPKNLGSD